MSVFQLVDLSVNPPKLVGQSVSQSVSLLVSQSVSWSVSLSGKSVSQSLGQSVSHLVSQSVSLLVSQSVSHSLGQSVLHMLNLCLLTAAYLPFYFQQRTTNYRVTGMYLSCVKGSATVSFIKFFCCNQWLLLG